MGLRTDRPGGGDDDDAVVFVARTLDEALKARQGHGGREHLDYTAAWAGRVLAAED